MLHKLSSRCLTLLGAIGLLGLATAATAADITLNTTMPVNTDWNSTGYWSDGQGASSANDYWVGIDKNGTATAGTNMRTPIADNTFPGASLHIGLGGNIGFKPASIATFTFPNLFLTDGCSLNQSSDNTTATILGKITLSGVCQIRANDVNIRNFVLGAQLVGPSNATLKLFMDGSGNDDTTMLNCTNNTFTGTIEQTGGFVKLRAANTLDPVTTYTLKTGANGAGTLDPDVDVTALSTNLVIATGSKVKLDKKINFKTVMVNGVKLADGYYSAAALQASYAAFFTNDGGALIVGTPAPLITVSPASAVTFSDINVMIQAGDKNAKTVTITNNGALPLNFIKQGAETNQGLVLAGSPLFSITSVSASTASALAPGASLTVNLQFGVAARTDYSATGSNAKAATLTIYTNATNQATTMISLSGNTAVPVEMSGFAAE